MPYQTSLAALQALRGVGGFQLGQLVQEEETEERRRALSRQRKFQRQSGIGRLLGGGGGGLAAKLLLSAIPGVGPLAAAALVGGGAGLGSLLGQKATTKKTRERRIGSGTFNVQAGREREQEFEDFARQMILANALSSAQSAGLGQFLFGGLPTQGPTTENLLRRGLIPGIQGFEGTGFPTP
jgi:hypothetical protein